MPRITDAYLDNRADLANAYLAQLADILGTERRKLVVSGRNGHTVVDVYRVDDGACVSMAVCGAKSRVSTWLDGACAALEIGQVWKGTTA